jgi:glycosyltransferase involved in cell wall biosynthesis
LLGDLGWEVIMTAQHEGRHVRFAQTLGRRGVPVLDGAYGDVPTVLSNSEFELAILVTWPVAELYLPYLRRLSPATKILVDSLDLHFLREMRRMLGGGSAPSRLLDEEFLTEFAGEINAYVAADAVLTVSEKEAALLEDASGGGVQALVVPDFEDQQFFATLPSERSGILFFGSYFHSPNVDALDWMLRDILPHLDPELLATHPLYLVGAGLPAELQALARTSPSVRVVGWVPSLDPYLERMRCMVAPLRYGAGTKRKLIQALSAGLPIVTTAVGAEGLELVGGEHALIADDAEELAAALSNVLTNDALAASLACAGHRHLTHRHAWSHARAALARAIETVGSRPPKPALFVEHEAPLDRYNRHSLMAYVRQQSLQVRTSEILRESVPDDARVLVVNDGIDEWLYLDGKTAVPFPRRLSEEPADAGVAAIDRLERERADGADILLLPPTAVGWLNEAPEAAQYLERRFTRLSAEGDTTVIFDLRDERPPVDDVRLIAFYLPQFQRIPEIDAWWGRGASEWINVGKAKPLFPGHEQPRVPTELGYYDLRLPDVREAQAALAREHGIHGFCYYHYWFEGKQLLEQPFEQVLRSGEPDFPFALCWANEPWSRHRDGAEEILQAQTYSREDDLAHIRALLPALADPRAIRIYDKPIFLVYRADTLPHPQRTAELWREEVVRAGLPGVELLAVETVWSEGWDVTRMGFDGSVLFQPHFAQLLRTPKLATGNAAARVFDYSRVWQASEGYSLPPYRHFETVFPGWDDSPRRGEQGIVVAEATPEAYERWLRRKIARARRRSDAEERIVFVNAWNKWGEGCYLEPDDLYGRGYLEATRRALYLDAYDGIDGDDGEDEVDDARRDLVRMMRSALRRVQRSGASMPHSPGSDSNGM